MSATTITPPRRLPRRDELVRASERTLLGVGPVVVSLLLLAFQAKIHAVAVDFRSAYYPAALRLLHGSNPYAVTHAEISAGTAFVYPALSAVAFAPFALLHRGAGEVIFMLVCIACVPATLRVLNVRDWRIYGVTLLWLPVYSGWQTANVTLPLMLLVALTWRYRDRPLTAGLLTAVAISLKPFIWPLALWLLATRRFKATAATVAWAVLINLVAWGIVGFKEIHTYLHLSGQVTDALYRGGYSMLAVAHHLGLGRGAGNVLLLLVSAAVGAALIYKGFIKRDERAALTLTIALMLVASPLVWSHYFALLLVPLAINRPRLSPLWFAPLLMWPCPPSTAVVGWQTALAWVVGAGSLLWLLKTDRRVGPVRL
jgi:alpha-1,2-mannosyltransferase